MTASQRLTLSTPLWRSFIALIATTVAFSGLLVTFNVAPAHAAEPTIVSLSFDDGYADQYAAAQYLQSKGLVGTFYINSGNLGDQGTGGDSAYLSDDEVLGIQGMGNEIGGHTKTHPEFAVDSVDPQDEICGDRTALQALTGKAVASFAWPYAYYTAALEAVAKGCGYSSARGLGDVMVPWVTCSTANAFCATGESLTAQADPFFTKAPPQVERTWTEGNLESLVNQTVSSTTSGKWLQLTFHHICADMANCPVTADGGFDPAYSLEGFKAFVNWLAGESAAGRVRVKTVGDAFAGNITVPPTAPSAVTAKAKDGSADVSWKSPVDDGGSPITGYTVTSTPGSTTCTTSALTCEVTGLKNGTDYTFTVTATNTQGTGAPSDASASVTPDVLPLAPTAVKAVPGDGLAEISWKTPADNGGSAIIGYTVTSSPGDKTCTTTGDLSCTITGLSNGTSYVFQVVAKNAKGDGPASQPSAAIGPASVPGAPSSVKALAGNASATVSWNAPVNDGGSKVTGFTVTSSPGGKTCTTTGALSCTVKGLSNGTAYTFKVTASNARGTGAASAPSASVKPTSALRVTVAKAGFGNVLAVNVDPDMRSGSYVFRVERRAANGKWAAVGNYRTVAPTQTKSITLGAGVFRVVVPAAGATSEATSGAVRLTAPTVQVKLRANGSKSKLVVDVDPNKGSGYWTFKVQKRAANGSWATLSTTYKTSGKAETRTVNQGKGTYRVVVAGKYGYQGAASTVATLSR